MGKRLVAAMAVLLMMATACAKTSDTGAPASPGASVEPTKYTIQIDSKGKSFNLVSTQYFPDQLSVHPGDTLDFKLNDTGEPHTVTMGSLVDAGLAAADKQPKKASGPDQKEPAELKKLPDIFPDSVDPAAPLNQSSAQPCYLDAGDKGDKLGLTACPKKEKPEFNGKQALFNSGYITEDQPFSMKFAKDTAPGTYSILCLFHRPLKRS